MRLTGKALRACTLALAFGLVAPHGAARADVHLFRVSEEQPSGPGEEGKDARRIAFFNAWQSVVSQSVTYLSAFPDVQALGATDEEVAAIASGLVSLDGVGTRIQVRTFSGTLRLDAACEIDLDRAAGQVQKVIQYGPAREATKDLRARSQTLQTRLIRQTTDLRQAGPGPDREQALLLRRESIRLMETLPPLFRAWVAMCGDAPPRAPLPGERESDPLFGRLWRPMLIPGSPQGKAMDRALDLARRAVGLNDRSPDAQAHLGLLLLLADSRDASIEAFRKSILLDPDLSVAQDGLGKALMEKEDFEGAVQAWNAAGRLNPQNPKIQVALAGALMRTGDMKGVERAWRRVIEIEPGNAQAHASLGNALMAAGDLDAAADAYRQAIDLQPETAAFHYGLGVVLYGRGDLDGAVAAYREAVTRNPGHVEAQHNLGVTLKAKGDLKGATAAYTRVIRLQPNYYEAYYNLGNVLMLQGELDGAVAAYQKAAQLNPGDASTHNNLGNALKARRDLDGAIRAYRMAVQIDPASAAQYNLGLILRQKGDRAGAIASFRAFIQFCTDERQKQQAEAILRDLTGGP